MASLKTMPEDSVYRENTECIKNLVLTMINMASMYHVML